MNKNIIGRTQFIWNTLLTIRQYFATDATARGQRGINNDTGTISNLYKNTHSVWDKI